MRLNTVGSARSDPRKNLQTMSEKLLFKILCCRFRFLFSESYDQFGQLRAMQLAIASSIFPQHAITLNGFLVRHQPLHLDYGCVVKGRSNFAKSTFFIPEGGRFRSLFPQIAPLALQPCPAKPFGLSLLTFPLLLPSAPLCSQKALRHHEQLHPRS